MGDTREPTREELDEYNAKGNSSTSTPWGGLAKYFSTWWWQGSRPQTLKEDDPEDIPDDDEVIDLFHGTEVHHIPRIMAEGLRPSSHGSGTHAVQEHYGLVVPAVYVTESFSTATQ